MATAPGKKQQAARLTRRSFHVDERALERAKKLLGAASDAEAVRLSVERMAEMEEFWRFMDKTRGTLPPGSFDEP
jgi:hypothetical protein